MLSQRSSPHPSPDMSFVYLIAGVACTHTSQNAPHTFHVHFLFLLIFFFLTKYDMWSVPGEGHKVNSSWRYSVWKCIYPCWPQSLSDLFINIDLTYLVFVRNASRSFSLLIKCDNSCYLNGQMWLRNCNCQPVRPSLCFLTSPAVKIWVGLITVQRGFFFLKRIPVVHLLI